jgi:hypothetical protein
LTKGDFMQTATRVKEPLPNTAKLATTEWRVIVTHGEYTRFGKSCVEITFKPGSLGYARRNRLSLIESTLLHLLHLKKKRCNKLSPLESTLLHRYTCYTLNICNLCISISLLFTGFGGYKVNLTVFRCNRCNRCNTFANKGLNLVTPFFSSV